MIPYVIVYSSLGMLAFISIDSKINRHSSLMFYPILALLMFFGGFQYGIDDYLTYQWLYEHALDFELMIPAAVLPGTSTMEVLYIFLSQIARYFSIPYPVFFFFLTILTIGIKLTLIKRYSPILFLSVFLYISLIFLKDITQMRGSIATSLIFISYIFAVKRQFFLFFIFVILATGFHTLAIVALPIYFLTNAKTPKAMVLSLLVILPASFYITFTYELLNIAKQLSAQFPVFGHVAGKLVGYLSSKEIKELKIGFGILFLIFIFLCGALNFKNLSPYQKACTASLWLGIVGFLMFRNFSVLAYRFLETYATFSLAFVVPGIMSLVGKELKIFFWALLLSYAAFFTYSPIYTQTIPAYQNILFL